MTTRVPDEDTFLGAYLRCALWASTWPNNQDVDAPEDPPLDRDYGISDFAPEALVQAAEDCERFQKENATDLSFAYEHAGYGYNESTAGHDFFLTRNGHGAGFWDRGLGLDLGERLTKSAHGFGESHPYPGDDGLIYWE